MRSLFCFPSHVPFFFLLGGCLSSSGAMMPTTPPLPPATKLDDARNECQQRLVAALKEFRILQAQVSRAAGGMHNQLLYPDTLKFLPVWTLGACCVTWSMLLRDMVNAAA